MISKSGVRAAVRTLDVFETFKEQKRPLSLNGIADEINAPISACHEIVKLRDRGYLYLVNSRSFYPTGRDYCLRSGDCRERPNRIPPGATGETVILGKLQNDHVMYLAIEEGLQTTRYSASVGNSTETS